jgi:translation initiation factor 1
MSKKLNAFSGLVYSTDPNFSAPKEEQEETETLAPQQQKLLIKLESKHRAGKLVTLITGFEGKQEDLETLAKQLKTKCGTGGSAKEGEIIIQGDYKEKVFLLLQQMNYSVKKR